MSSVNGVAVLYSFSDVLVSLEQTTLKSTLSPDPHEAGPTSHTEEYMT